MRIIHKYSFGSFNVADFIQKLLGISLHKLFILNQNTDIAFIVSPVSVPHNFIKVSAFRGLSISKGISFRLPIGFPPNCNSDGFCAVCQSVLGKKAKLLLEATIISAKAFRLTAAVTDLRLGGGVVLQKAGIQIEACPNPSIGIVGYMKLRKPAITLGAAIRATVAGVKLEGHLSGCLPNVFGSSYITICNLFLSVTLVPAPVPVTGLEFGGRIELGKKSCGRVFTAEGYVGVSVANPAENYFYANIGRLTFRTFFDAFCIRVSIPRPLAESGFPDGIKASFSLLGKELPHARISIPVGYFFKGAINILGLRASAEIKIQPNRIYIKAGLPPVNVAGLFKMYASRSDRSRGPYLIADVSTKKLPYLEASGFAELLGISAEIKMLISSTKYEYSINGKFLNLFYVGFRIQASYGNLAKAHFVVEGWFKNDLFDKIASSVRNGLKRSADEADRHIKAAQQKIRQKKEAFYRADRALVNAQRKVDDAKRAFDHAIAKLEHARRRARNICHIRSCGSWCVGCPRGWRCCGRWWGRCVCHYPGWHSCCWRIPDVVCHAANAACWVIRRAIDFALRVAIWVVNKSKHILDVAKAAIQVARGVVYVARYSLDIAIAFLDRVRHTYRIGVKAITAVVNFILTKIINIREIYFKVGLGVANGGVFQCRIRGVLMGAKINVNLRIDTRNIWSIIRSLAEKAIPGLSKFIG